MKNTLRAAPHLRRLVVLCVVYALVVVASVATNGAGVAVLAWLALAVALLAFDWRGAWSLAGLVPWHKLPGWARVVVAVLMVAYWPVSMGIYLVRAVLASLHEGQRVVAERPARIARLERDLGV